MAVVSQFMGRLMPALMPRLLPPIRIAVRAKWVPTSELLQAVSIDTAEAHVAMFREGSVGGHLKLQGHQGSSHLQAP